jgi:hypothetical protein
MECPRGFLLVHDKEGNRVPFFVKTRQDDIVWNEPTDSKIIDLLNNSTNVMAMNPEKSYNFDNAKHYNGNSVYTWYCNVNTDGLLTGITEIPFTYFSFTDEESKEASYTVELPTPIDKDVYYSIILTLSTDSPVLRKSFLTYDKNLNEEGKVTSINVYINNDVSFSKYDIPEHVTSVNINLTGLV